MRLSNIILLLTFFLLQCDFKFNNPVDPDVFLSPPKKLQLVQEGEWIRLNWLGTDTYTTGYLIMRKSIDEDWLSILSNENLSAKEQLFLIRRMHFQFLDLSEVSQYLG